MSHKKDTPSLKEIIANSPENKKCVDCGMARPQWASITYGIFLCLNCAGTHRSYGVKVSTVKSMSMDVWSPAETKRMELGGNAQFLEYLKKHSLENLSKDDLYQHKAVKEYADKLKKSVSEIFPEEKIAAPQSSPKEKKKAHSTPSPAAVDVKLQSESAPQPSYINMYNTSVSSGLPSMETIQTGITEVFGKAAEYFYSASSTISEHLSEKVIAPASTIIKEKGSQLTDYIRGKETNRRAVSKAAEKSAVQKTAEEKPNVGKNKSSFDKWD
ncbi:ADP-ribosylation factor GTPase-activating protein 1 [Nematocida minor]|uniref:ADP-ribosylation factor GTPase-activating protein 1 n=1 Tax=Nematocida minor TaxID=1912983 RepID=UPI002220C77A|nr:ADP-ribosylation factor GTPase-activating protein 1 [Nematocida minor]KAI5190245.1 ADP-ribosylation factor GTPase-activating protein 1 [Nematocida minor]